MDEYVDEETGPGAARTRSTTVVGIELTLIFLAFCAYVLTIAYAISFVTIPGAVVAIMIGWAAAMCLVSEVLR